METAASLLLILHITAGSAALATGTLAMLARKGGTTHRRSGSVFFWCMVAVATTALMLSTIRGSAFLFHIGVFSLYQAHGGWRSIRNKALKPTFQDVAMTAVGGINGGWMIATGHMVLMVFGAISMLLALQDTRTFLRSARGDQLPAKAWLRRHIGMMLGTYIATLTAFLLTALRELDLGVIAWLGPTAIGVPCIIYATRKFTGPRTRPVEA
ncbi:MAG: hypothetical protein KIT10_03260 [Flavobacteriales bacterium]|nr:hypothetical protein [Flavobacteriales bacterium]